MQKLLGVRWGISAIDAMLVAADGTILESTRIVERLSETSRPAIAERIASFDTMWPGTTRIWLAGMIGSPDGWCDVPHLACPAGISDFATLQEYKVAALNCTLVPGLKIGVASGDADFMRGEEILAIGRMASSHRPSSELLLCVPGMHGKWICLENDRIVRFHSAMTVELATMIEQNISFAASFAAVAEDGPTFRNAVARGMKGGALARLLFGIRSGLLSGRLAPQSAAAELWGLLIGADIADAIALYASSGDLPPVCITGAPDVVRLYAAAFDILGLRATTVEADRLAAKGFASLQTMNEVEYAA